MEKRYLGKKILEKNLGKILIEESMENLNKNRISWICAQVCSFDAELRGDHGTTRENRRRVRVPTARICGV